ncbi:MAG: (2Fe-2S)-binding protein [Caulobacteraceae bacterium]
MYVCNCNGIRERDARAAIQAGARKPAHIFRHCQSAPRCAKCVCDMRRMIQDSDQALKFAAE